MPVMGRVAALISGSAGQPPEKSSMFILAQILNTIHFYTVRSAWPRSSDETLGSTGGGAPS